MKKFLLMVVLLLLGVPFLSFAQQPTPVQNISVIDYNFDHGGWYLVSVPVEPLYTRDIFELFPGAKRVVRWNNINQWYQDLVSGENSTQWSPKEGLWVEVRESFSVSIDGYPVPVYSTSLPQGWSLVGSTCQRTVWVGNPTDDPDGSVVATFGWDQEYPHFGYYPTDVIEKQKGYWVYSVQPCSFSLGQTPGEPGSLGKLTGIMPPPPPWVTTGIEKEKNKAPDSFFLFQNYPNPFNPTTEITYQLPKMSQVKISVHNNTGQRVAVLVSGNQPAGTHRVVWNGKNEFGETLPSGVYFYRLQAGKYAATRKMIFQK